jgi:drug/metabolite transporter (DMT)-like permease
MTITVVLLGLTAALAYGTSDFLGGIASRNGGSSLAVVALFKLISLAVFVFILPFAGEMYSNEAVLWGGLGGVSMGAAYIAYFRGLRVGSMGIVATIAAIWAAVVPVAVGTAIGERPAFLAWMGIAAIIIAIPAITYTRQRIGDSVQNGKADRRSGVLEGTVAGIGFGLFFVALARGVGQTGELAWPLLATASSSAVVVGASALYRRVRWKPAFMQWRAIIGAGLTYAAATWAYIAAASEGWMSIPAVLAALSPAPTMILAWLLLSESLRPRQIAGIVFALFGVALITMSMPG